MGDELKVTQAFVTLQDNSMNLMGGGQDLLHMVHPLQTAY